MPAKDTECVVEISLVGFFVSFRFPSLLTGRISPGSSLRFGVRRSPKTWGLLGSTKTVPGGRRRKGRVLLISKTGSKMVPGWSSPCGSRPVGWD